MDTAVYLFERAAYTVIREGDALIVNGGETLVDVEYLAFADQTVPVDLLV